MRNLHIEKKGLRGLAIAESFKQNSKKSILSGVVMRNDFQIDGFVFGSATLEGDDSTQTVLQMYEKLQRPDINYLLLSGLIISMYNIVNIKKLFELLQLPIIGITYNESEGITDSIKHHFPNSFEEKLSNYQQIGNRKRLKLKTNYDLFVRIEGCNISEAKHLLNTITIQGSMPEPVRVAQLLSKSLLQEGLSF